MEYNSSETIQQARARAMITGDNRDIIDIVDNYIDKTIKEYNQISSLDRKSKDSLEFQLAVNEKVIKHLKDIKTGLRGMKQ